MYSRLRLYFANRPTGWRLLATLATLAISFAILGGLIYSQREALTDFEFQISPLPLLATAGLFSVNLFFVAVIWGWIFNSLGEKFRLSKHVRIYILSNLTKRLPGTVWYIASRAEFYRREGVARRLTTAASGVEFAISLLTSGIVALVFTFSLVSENQLGLMAVGLVVVISLLASQPRVANRIFMRLGVEAKDYSFWILFQWLLSYTGAWLLAGAVVFSIARVFYDLPLTELGFVIGSVALTNLVTAALFFAPSNLGITEVSLTILLSRVMPAPHALIISIATRLIIIALEAFWALILIWSDS